MAMIRRVEPEWLDELPAQDARAVRSRRDLRRINTLMANARIVAGELRGACAGGIRTMAEIGAGDGALAVTLPRALRNDTSVDLELVDRQDVVPRETLQALAAEGWRARSVCADVFDWLRQPGPATLDAMVANLFLHHFEGERLVELLRLVSTRTRVFVACEPRRSGFALAGARMVGLIGCNDVSRHDAVASVHAGFRDFELSSLWPDRGAWTLREGPRGPFSHCFVAVRTP
jgi:hypothetical protein